MTRPPPPTFAKLGVTDPHIAMNLRIFLDAVEQSGCTEYNTEAGYLVRYAMEPADDTVRLKRVDGNLVRVVPRFKVVGDEIATERVEGIVEVMWKDEP